MLARKQRYTVRNFYKELFTFEYAVDRLGQRRARILDFDVSSLPEMPLQLTSGPDDRALMGRRVGRRGASA